MKVWETKVGENLYRIEADGGIVYDTLRLFVDGQLVSTAKGGMLDAEINALGTWTAPTGEQRHARAWVGWSWTSLWLTVDCRLWLEGELVFEEDVLTRTADRVRSVRRALETARS